MNLLEFKGQIENLLKEENLPVELQYLSYSPYAFGNGQLVYRIKGYCIIFLYDGRDFELGICRNKRHLKWNGKIEPDKYFTKKGFDFVENEFHNLLVDLDLLN